MEDELDAILSQINPKPLLSLESVTFELLNDDSGSPFLCVPSTIPVQGSLPSNQPHPSSQAGISRFHTLITDDDVEVEKKAIPKNTDKNITVGMKGSPFLIHTGSLCLLELPCHDDVCAALREHQTYAYS